MQMTWDDLDRKAKATQGAGLEVKLYELFYAGGRARFTCWADGGKPTLSLSGLCRKNEAIELRDALNELLPVALYPGEEEK